MMAHAVVLKPERDGFVRALSGSDLTLAGFGLLRTDLPCRGRIQRRHDGRLSVSQVADALASLTGFGNARGDVVNATRVLVLVPVLATGARSREPFDAEIVVGSTRERIVCRNIGVDDSDCHGAGMNPAPSLGWWNTLDAVSADFVVEC